MKIPGISLRLRFALVGFLGLSIFAVGSLTIFASAWIERARAYSLLSLQRTLETADVQGDPAGTTLNPQEWGFYSQPGKELQWLKSFPGGEVNPAFFQRLTTQITSTGIRQGSFAIASESSDRIPKQTFMIVFRTVSGGTLVIGAPAPDDLREMLRLALPFLGIFAAAYFVILSIIFGLASYVSRSLKLLSTALNQMGAGRLTDFELPEISDPDFRELASSLEKFGSLLHERNEQLAKVSQLADEDSMTNLPNYRAFQNYIRGTVTQIQLPQPSGDNGINVLAIIDLDFFKKVNDTHGHLVGDLVLKQMGATIKKNIRSGRDPTGREPDFCGRYGGEEFVVLFSRCKAGMLHIGPMRVLNGINQLVVDVPAEIAKDGQAFKLKVTASIGLAPWDAQKFKSIPEWIKAADEAMYMAKKRGRNRIITLAPTRQEWTL